MTTGHVLGGAVLLALVSTGAQEIPPSPGNNDENGTQQDLPNRASPDNPTTNPDAGSAVD